MTRCYQHPTTMGTSECSKHTLTCTTLTHCTQHSILLSLEIRLSPPSFPRFVCIDNTLLWINGAFSAHLGKLSCREAFKLVYFLCNKCSMGERDTVCFPVLSGSGTSDQAILLTFASTEAPICIRILMVSTRLLFLSRSSWTSGEWGGWQFCSSCSTALWARTAQCNAVRPEHQKNP